MSVLGLILLIILSVIAIFLVICLFVKIRLIVSFQKPRDGNFSFDVTVTLSGGRVVFYKTFGLSEKNHKSKTGTGESDEQKTDNEKNDNVSLTQKIKKYYNTFLKIKYTYLKSERKIRKSVFAEKICISAGFGLEDAFKTGLATGAVWAGIYNVIAFMTKFMTVTEPEINVNPDFENQFIEASGECIFRLSFANIISMACSLGINYYIINKKMTKKEKAAINYGNTD
ncbi:MAG: DUF2953 domain-containing protein [Clostridia bacterium]|nr:DUF2953 domain-containing protein [Clostridia bacterium]